MPEQRNIPVFRPGAGDVSNGSVDYYPMDWAYYLLIGGSSLESPPLYIRLVSACAPGHYIDVRYADIDQFIDSSPGIPRFPMPKCWPPIRKMPPE